MAEGLIDTDDISALRWARDDAKRIARSEARRFGKESETRSWAQKAARYTLRIVALLAVTAGAGSAIGAEDSMLQGFVDGGQRWGW